MDLCRRTIRQQVGKANIERGRVEEEVEGKLLCDIV